MSFGDKNFTYGPRIVKGGLVFYMDAANPNCYISGNTTCNDLISNVSGTLINGTGFSTENNGSWSFDGSDDNISCDSINEINNVTSLTFSFWGKKNGSGEVLGFNTIQNVSTDKVVLYWWLNGFVYFACRNGASNVSPSISLSYDTDWHYFVGVYVGGSTLKLYVDGELSDTESGAPASLSSNIGDNLTIGYVNNSDYSKGNISNVKIYNKELSQTEITQNYNTLKGRFGL